VIARGPRLSACFNGAQRPGALRWTAAVDPVRGTLSDQTLEPTLDGDELTRSQRVCAFDVLADPGYSLSDAGLDDAGLDGAGDRDASIRVGMVIEF